MKSDMNSLKIPIKNLNGLNIPIERQIFNLDYEFSRKNSL